MGCRGRWFKSSKPDHLIRGDGIGIHAGLRNLILWVRLPPSEPIMPYKDLKKQREYQRVWMKKRRDEWFEENGPCVKCGSLENLELDHIDPDKKVSHSVWSWSLLKREEELSKCQVLCRECHIRKTCQDFRWGDFDDHGANRYHYGCRCEVCTMGERDRQRDYRKCNGRK